MKTGGSHGRREVQNLRPELVQRIREELKGGPVSKSELARRLRVSRPTIIAYMRRLADAPALPAPVAATVDGERHKPATQDEVLERVQRACNEIEEQIRALQASSTSTAAVSTVFKGYGVLERFVRLLAELRQELAPPQQNLFVQLSAAMSQNVELPARLVGDQVAAPR